MAIGVYLVFNPPIPDLGLNSDGKFLASQLDALASLAMKSRTPSLIAYMDQRRPGPDDDDLDLFMASWSEWFPADDGILTVTNLLAALALDPAVAGSEEEQEWLEEELENLRDCLEDAKVAGSKFRIEIMM